LGSAGGSVQIAWVTSRKHTWVTSRERRSFSLLLSPEGQEAANAHRWKLAFLTLDACVPEEKRQMMAETLKDYEGTMWMDIGFRIFGRVAGNTLTLVLGWSIRTFLQ
jgi:hypothetical protein